MPSPFFDPKSEYSFLSFGTLGGYRLLNTTTYKTLGSLLTFEIEHGGKSGAVFWVVLVLSANEAKLLNPASASC